MHYVHDDPADRRHIETSITIVNTRLNLKGISRTLNIKLASCFCEISQILISNQLIRPKEIRSYTVCPHYYAIIGKLMGSSHVPMYHTFLQNIID